MGMAGMILYFGALFAIFYFLLIRPQKKRQKAVDDMQNSISVGDWIMTNGGLYGKVVDIVNEFLIVEFGTNKSVLVPISKQAIASVGEPNLTRKRIEEVEEDIDDEDEDFEDEDFDFDEDEDFLDEDE
ncbi:preprotein translocase subunit YajC [Vallitalea okinawensis]|uniref:preprotein translocase subunit YajC n=1 Tax=Vallitalea okinawensis TaxID=2078660 RepID=UPI001FA83A32|nr:preprotein translocase subunit YajC [Vallitalea okinawensis]